MWEIRFFQNGSEGIIKRVSLGEIPAFGVQGHLFNFNCVGDWGEKYILF